MKHSRLLHLAAWLFAATLLSSCLSEETEEAGTPGGANRQPLLVSVTDGGLLPAAGTPTRATDTDLQTAFVNGDYIGLYAVKDGQILPEASNLRLGISNGQWYFERGKELYYAGPASGIIYYAYYPYNANQQLSALVETGSGDALFFAPLIASWSPNKEQDGYGSSYSDSDLMTGTGQLLTSGGSSPSLAFSMTHRMALNIMQMPYYHCTTTPDGQIAYPANALAWETLQLSDGAKARYVGAGIYRYLTNPVTSTALGGAINGTGIAFSITSDAMVSGRYYLFDQRKELPEHVRAMVPGDYYMSDGTILPFDAAAVTPNCIGVVLKADRDTNGDWVDDSVYKLKDGVTPMPNIHGYVLALSNMPTWSPWIHPLIMAEMGTGQLDTKGFYGYKYTQQIRQYMSDNNLNIQDMGPLYNTTEAYEQERPAPAFTSGWFMLSAGQGAYWVQNKDQLLYAIRKAAGKPSFLWDIAYWTSSEDARAVVNHAWVVNPLFGQMETQPKTTLMVQSWPILAF